MGHERSQGSLHRYELLGEGSVGLIGGVAITSLVDEHVYFTERAAGTATTAGTHRAVVVADVGVGEWSVGCRRRRKKRLE